jgi:hypothetical protein
MGGRKLQNFGRRSYCFAVDTCVFHASAGVLPGTGMSVLTPMGRRKRESVN